MTRASIAARESAVLHVGGLYYASEKAVVERVLARRRGVTSVEANPVAQTATVVYDPDATSVEALHKWVEECGYHCAGQSAPGHICDPLVAPDHGPHDHEATARADEADGHGHGGHAGMSMAAMVARHAQPLHGVARLHDSDRLVVRGRLGIDRVLSLRRRSALTAIGGCSC